jgi:CobQ-like glutamine amidotransferase family enzyme
MTALTIVQLYPDELGVAGDRGNVMALTARLEHAGHSVTVVAHEVGSELPADVDLVVVGNGPLSAMRNILDLASTWVTKQRRAYRGPATS